MGGYMARCPHCLGWTRQSQTSCDLCGQQWWIKIWKLTVEDWIFLRVNRIDPEQDIPEYK